jgi:hypothetical protein
MNRYFKIVVLLVLPFLAFGQKFRQEIQNYTAVSNLRNEALTPRKNDKVYIHTTKKLYAYDHTNSTSADDGLNYIVQTAGSYRWVCLNCHLRVELSQDSILLQYDANDILVQRDTIRLPKFVETVTNATNTISGNRIATYTNESGVSVDIDETNTTVVNNGDGTYTFTNESGVTSTFPAQVNTDTRLALSVVNDSLKVDVINILTGSIVSTSFIDNIINKAGVATTTVTSIDGSVSIDPTANNYDLGVKSHSNETQAVPYTGTQLPTTAGVNIGDTKTSKFCDGTIVDYTYNGTTWLVDFVHLYSHIAKDPVKISIKTASYDNIINYCEVAGIEGLQKKALKNFVAELQDKKLYDKIIWMYPILGDNAISQSIEFFNPSYDFGINRLKFEGDVIHGIDGFNAGTMQGYAYTPKFLTAAANTGFSYYSTAATNDQFNTYGDGLIGTRDNANPTSVNASVASNVDLCIFKDAANRVYGYCNDGTLCGGTTFGQAESGLTSIFRDTDFANNKSYIYHNGIKIEESTSLPQYAAATNSDFYIGNPRTFNDTKFKFVAYHYSLTSTEALDFYNAVQKFQTELGREEGSSQTYTDLKDIIQEKRDAWEVVVLNENTPWPNATLDGAKLIYDGGAYYQLGGWNVPFNVYKSTDGINFTLYSNQPAISSRHYFGLLKFGSKTLVIAGDPQNPNTEIWSTEDYLTFTLESSNVLSNRSGSGYGVINNYLYCVGGVNGLNNTDFIDEVWRTKDLKCWELVSTGQLPLKGVLNGTLLAINNTLIACGSYRYDNNPANRLSYREVYTSIDGITWNLVGELPVSNYFFDFCTDGESLYGFGGVNNWLGGNDSNVNSAYLYVSKDMGKTWSTSSLTHSNADWIGHHAAALAVTENGILVSSGNGDIALNNNKIYLIKRKW